MNVAPSEPLSQVVFVHDYFQLVFQDEILSVYNTASINIGGVVLTHGEPGFADALVALIDQTATPAKVQPGLLLALNFASGVQLRIGGEGISSALPEAFSFASHTNGFVVQQNE
jgi:hypothetical protein